MAVSKLRDNADCTTEFAAVEAPARELVEVLSRSQSFRKKFGELEGDSIPAIDNDAGYVVAYSLVNSDWTILDPIQSRMVEFGAIERATKKLKTQAVLATFCGTTGSYGYVHTRNGRSVEEYCDLDAEYHDDSPTVAAQKGYQVSSSGNRRLKTKRDLAIDFENTDGFELLSDLSTELGVEIPDPQWDLEEDPLRVEQFLDHARRSRVASAFLLYVI